MIPPRYISEYNLERLQYTSCSSKDFAPARLLQSNVIFKNDIEYLKSPVDPDYHVPVEMQKELTRSNSSFRHEHEVLYNLATVNSLILKLLVKNERSFSVS